MNDMNNKENNNDHDTLCSQSENVKDDACFRLLKTQLPPFSPPVTQKSSSLQSSDYSEKRNEPESNSSPYIVSNFTKTITTNSSPNSISKIGVRSSVKEEPIQQDSSSMPLSTIEIVGIALGALIVIAIIGFCCYSYFKRRYATFREPSPSHQETGTISTSTNKRPVLQNNHHNSTSKFSSRTTRTIDSYTAMLTSNTQRVDSPSPTEGGSSGLSVGGRSTPSNAFNISNTTLYYNGIEVPPPGARIIPLELQMQIGKEIMAQREDTRNSLLPYLGTKYKLPERSSSTINNRPCSL
ncbi:7616_t:CDS:2 [Dentiscutata erythropus]|uniref:7616_t:CDS:1 n=1 Tax=Dentiscutata erythropus TaxID=1348616 RepID=A0A9N9IXX2_9GLOM|nr:7616_t:CDS:2 [Dentiscutata erythropus]